MVLLCLNNIKIQLSISCSSQELPKRMWKLGLLVRTYKLFIFSANENEPVIRVPQDQRWALGKPKRYLGKLLKYV